jgi:hypothetical protein
MTSSSFEQALVLLAVLLLLGSQLTLWWRAGRAAPQATLPAAVTQASALGVLALYLDQAGLRRPAMVVALAAATAGIGIGSALRTTGHRARAGGHGWMDEHRKGVRSTIVAVEAVVAAVALATTIAWAADRFNSDFDPKADHTLCSLLDHPC